MTMNQVLEEELLEGLEEVEHAVIVSVALLKRRHFHHLHQWALEPQHAAVGLVIIIYHTQQQAEGKQLASV